jgi:hypothetical protein
MESSEPAVLVDATDAAEAALVVRLRLPVAARRGKGFITTFPLAFGPAFASVLARVFASVVLLLASPVCVEA